MEKTRGIGGRKAIPILKEFSRTSEVALELQKEFNHIISLA